MKHQFDTGELFQFIDMVKMETTGVLSTEYIQQSADKLHKAIELLEQFAEIIQQMGWNHVDEILPSQAGVNALDTVLATSRLSGLVLNRQAADVNNHPEDYVYWARIPALPQEDQQ